MTKLTKMPHWYKEFLIKQREAYRKRHREQIGAQLRLPYYYTVTLYTGRSPIPIHDRTRFYSQLEAFEYGRLRKKQGSYASFQIEKHEQKFMHIGNSTIRRNIIWT